MFNLIGKLKSKNKNSPESINLKSLIDGLNLYENYFIYKDSNKIKIYDRKCDHAGGKIISKNGLHKCPQHNWIFNPITGKYNNGIIKKESTFKIKKGKLIIASKQETPSISKSKENSLIKIRFFNHAFVQIKTDKFKFATDPWAIGSAFSTGWWLKFKTKNDWIKELNSCDFIYVSHNHPDHLHKITLSNVRKDMVFFVPKFISDSTAIYLESIGFKNIFRANFLNEYNFNGTNLNLSIFKSRDFREDSGLYFSIGNFTSLFSVDSNQINFNNLPKVNLYASTFAGGATGFPLMFDNYNLNEKIKVHKQIHTLEKILKKKDLEKITPNYFLPYAGFFTEKLRRDKFIKKYNKKNKISDYKKLSSKMNFELLDVEKHDEFYFQNNVLIKKDTNKNKLYNDINPESYLKEFKLNFNKIDRNYIKKYFLESKFNDNLLLIISLTDDSFKKVELEFIVDFSKKKINFTFSKNFKIKKIHKIKNQKYLHIKCRKESFLSVIYSKEPWEDLSIGFQCKILRHPNEYNYKFWYYFTNIYITDKNIRMSSNCNNCDFLIQSLSNQIKNIN